MPDSSHIDLEIRPGLRLSSGLALFVESLRALIVADVHWGYAVSQRRAGRLLPQWGDEAIQERLDALVRHYRPALLVVAGDVVHAPAGAGAARTGLASLPDGLEIVCVGGNHDRKSPVPCAPSFQAGGLFIHHGDRDVAVPPGALEIVGHFHPAATWSDGTGTALKLPALVDGPRRLILPAFSPWAAGVPWNRRLGSDERLWFIAPRRIFPWRPSRREPTPQPPRRTD